MRNQLVQAQVDDEITAQATVVLAEMGLTVSDAVRILLTKIAHEKIAPLELLAPNETTFAAFEEVSVGNLPRFDGVQALMDDLHADDWANGQFKRDYKREAKGRHRATLDVVLMLVLEALATDVPLGARYQDHALSGDLKGYRDCHVKPDLVLIYQLPDEDTLVLARLGSHAELSLWSQKQAMASSMFETELTPFTGPWWRAVAMVFLPVAYGCQVLKIGSYHICGCWNCKVRYPADGESWNFRRSIPAGNPRRLRG